VAWLGEAGLGLARLGEVGLGRDGLGEAGCKLKLKNETRPTEIGRACKAMAGMEYLLRSL